MAHGHAQGECALPIDRGEHGATNGRHRATEEFAGVDEVATDVGERAGTRSTFVAPAHWGLRICTVIAPVVGVKVLRRTEGAGLRLFLDGRDSG